MIISVSNVIRVSIVIPTLYFLIVINENVRYTQKDRSTYPRPSSNPLIVCHREINGHRETQVVSKVCSFRVGLQ